MPTFVVSDWKESFKTQLEARPGLSGVTIYDAEQTLPDTDREAVVLGDWETTTDHLTFRTQEEITEVEGRIRIVHPSDAKSARDRAVAILTEVKDAVTADYEANSTVFDSMFTRYSAEEDVWADNGRVCTFEFAIRIEAHS